MCQRFPRRFVFVVPAAPMPTSADGSDLGLHAVSSEFPPSPHDDSAPLVSSVATPASSTVVLDKAALGAIPSALPVHKDSVVRQLDSGPQASSAISHSASRVAGTNRAQVPAVPAASPLLPSPSQTALPSLLPTHFVSGSPPPSRRCWQAPGRRGLWCRPIGSYSTSRPTTSPYRAKTETAPAAERPFFSSCSRALHRPSFCCADPTRHRCSHTCSALTWCPPSGGTSAWKHPSRFPRVAITARNRVHRVCRAVLAHRLGA